MIAVVTGGCKGLGENFTKYLLSLGYKVYAIYNKSVDNAYIMENEYDNLRCIKCDIRKESEVDSTFFNIDDIDILINNAAISKDEDIAQKSGKDFLSVLETNVVGTFLVTKYALPKMSEKGVIINISSNNSLDNFNPISIDYDASKAGVNMLTKDFAVVTDRKVVAYAPGWINTSEVINMNQDFLRVEMEKVGQEKLIDLEDLVKYIISDVEKRESGEIVEVKNL